MGARVSRAIASETAVASRQTLDLFKGSMAWFSSQCSPDSIALYLAQGGTITTDPTSSAVSFHFFTSVYETDARRIPELLKGEVELFYDSAYIAQCVQEGRRLPQLDWAFVRVDPTIVQSLSPAHGKLAQPGRLSQCKNARPFVPRRMRRITCPDNDAVVPDSQGTPSPSTSPSPPQSPSLGRARKRPASPMSAMPERKKACQGASLIWPTPCSPDRTHEEHFKRRFVDTLVQKHLGPVTRGSADDLIIEDVTDLFEAGFYQTNVEKSQAL